MQSDNEIRARQKMRNRITLILLALFTIIIFALSFSHIVMEQTVPPAKNATLVGESGSQPRPGVSMAQSRTGNGGIV